jgi:hypothetical protein
METHANDGRRGPRPKPLGAAVFFAALAVLLLAAIAIGGVFGIPGTTGGTSLSQQESSGAPQPTNDIHTGDVRETTGAGAPVGARPPRP